MDVEKLDGGAGYGYNVYGVGTMTYFTGRSGSALTYGDGSGVKDGLLKLPAQTIQYADNCDVKASSFGKGYSYIYPQYKVDGDRRQVFAAGNVARGGNIHFRHGGTAGVCWADGHVTSEKYVRPSANSTAACIAAKVGTFGPDDTSLWDPWDLVL